MATSSVNDRLNDLLVELHRSLVQYTMEAWPWTGEHDRVRKVRGPVQDVAERQQRDVALLVELLSSRWHPIDFGVYPDEYTSFNYVSLEYLSGKLIEHQRGLTVLLETTADDLVEDPQAHKIVKGIAASQREGLANLEDLRVPPAAPVSA